MILIIDVDKELYLRMKERFKYSFADTMLEKVGLAVSKGVTVNDDLEIFVLKNKGDIKND